MQGKNKYRIKGSGDFLRYHGDKMDERERNAFEKSLQQDPFAEEASAAQQDIDKGESVRVVALDAGVRSLLRSRLFSE